MAGRQLYGWPEWVYGAWRDYRAGESPDERDFRTAATLGRAQVEIYGHCSTRFDLLSLRCKVTVLSGTATLRDMSYRGFGANDAVVNTGN